MRGPDSISSFTRSPSPERPPPTSRSPHERTAVADRDDGDARGGTADEAATGQAAAQKAAAIAYATRMCKALSPVLGELRDAIDLNNYQLEQRSSVARETIAQIVKDTHSASLFVLAALGYVLAGGLPAFTRDLERGPKKPR